MVTGTPCVGKTAVSVLLASRLNALHVDLGELVERERLSSGVDKARGALIVDTGRVASRVREILESCELDVIVDGHYAVDVAPAKAVHRVFVLRRDPEELKRLMEAHGFEGKKLWENLAAEILDVSLYDAVRVCGQDRVCEINATSKTVVEVVGEIVSVLEGEKSCAVGIVDWLGKLEKEKRLDEFLKKF